MGIPRAGKTTQINLLKKSLIQKDISVKVITDRFRASNLQINQ